MLRHGCRINRSYSSCRGCAAVRTRVASLSALESILARLDRGFPQNDYVRLGGDESAI
jgi:hypothetical protein